MCYICRCFGWILDLLQRILTFLLACIMCCAICIGLLVAIGAGIAYGYNYSIAEFLTFTRSDVTVYVRRGQFADRPEVRPNSRRMGADGSEVDDGNDLFSSNYTADYQDPGKLTGDDSRPLSDAWQKAQDSRAYADKLTKYSKVKSAMRPYPRAEEEEVVKRLLLPKEIDDDTMLYTEETSQESHDSTRKPTLTTATDGQPTARRFIDLSDKQPVHIVTPTESTKMETPFDPGLAVNREIKKHKHRKFKKPDVKIEVVDGANSLYLQPQSNSSKYINREYSEDLDYLYKSV